MATVLHFDQLAPMLRAIPSLSRPVLAGLTEKLIERLDEIDGDDDVEPNGDELDGSAQGEDEFCPHAIDSITGPGCLLSDPDGESV